MKRLTATTVLTFLVYLALAAVVVFAFVTQQDRINRGNERYDRLFEAYQLLDRDCTEADDCFTDAPSPAEVAEAEPGTPGEPGQPGADGRDGKDGKTPTYAELMTLVQAFCEANSGCAGPAGANGSNGENGSPGAAGPPGSAGAEGRGIASISCVRDESLSTYFRFTFTDGTTTDVRAECTPTEPEIQ